MNMLIQWFNPVFIISEKHFKDQTILFCQKSGNHHLRLHNQSIGRLLSGIGKKKSLSHLQLIQNSAARILTPTRKHGHISPILASLHELPVAFRIDFNILLITYKAHRGSKLFIRSCNVLCPFPLPEVIGCIVCCCSKVQIDT